MNPSLSIVIVNYNVKELLLSCIQSIYGQLNSDTVEVIIVDNASTDQSKEFIVSKFPEVVWIQNEANVGFSSANNQGIRISKSPVIFLLNPDTEVKPGTLAGLLKYQSELPNSILAPRLLNSDGTLQLSCWRFPKVISIILEALYLHKLIDPNGYSNSVYANSFQPDSASGAALMFTRETAQKTSGLDENLFWSEDVDFCYRAHLLGIPVHYFPDLPVIHHSGKSSRKNLNIPISNQLLSKAKYLKKHKGSVAWFVAVLFIFIHIITRLFVFALLAAYRPSEFQVKLKAYIFTFTKYFHYVFNGSNSVT